MKKITIDGYKNYTSTLRVEKGEFGCPYLTGTQNWDSKLRADIYVGSNRELAKMWQIFRVVSDYSLPYDEPLFFYDGSEYCIVVEFENKFGSRVPTPKICRVEDLYWVDYMDVTPYAVAYRDLTIAEDTYKRKLEEWEKEVHSV